MDVNLPPDLHLEVRRIRNIEVWRSDLLPLIVGRQKIPSIPINAFGAQLQDWDQGGDQDYIIFSSWLGALISGEWLEGRAEGTIEGHIKAACPNDTLEALLASPRWILPLCGGGNVKHWVLTWVDYGASEIAIFDSIPELGSHRWALPLCIQVVSRIRKHVMAPTVDFDNWAQRVLYPPPLQRQMDGWACGLFLLMAMKACALKKGFEQVIDDKREEMRQEVLEALLKLPIVQVRSPVLDAESDGEVISIEKPSTHQNGTEKVVPSYNNCLDNSAAVLNKPPVTRETEQTIATAKEKPKRILTTGKRKAPHHDSDDNSGNATEEEKKLAKRMKVAKSSRAPKRSVNIRKEELEADEWTLTVEAKRVLCKGCNKWKEMHRPYETKEWEKHKRVCSGITGKAKVRVLNSKLPLMKAPPGVKPIANFFTSNTPLMSTESVNTAPKFVTKTVNLTPSIAHIWSPTDPNAKKIQQHTLPPKTCKHLSGPEYDDYVRLIRTRSLGGVSPELRARATRQLFPYKGLPLLEKEPRTKDIGLIFVETKTRSIPTSAKTPKDGNDFQSEKKWTKQEKRRLDEVLLGWARWEVDYVNGFVRSARCEGMTTNADGICDACMDVSTDESLKRSIRRKVAEAALPALKQHELLMKREKHTPQTLLGTDSRQLGDKLKDPLIHRIHLLLENSDHTKCFLSLYQAAQEGKLNNSQTFTELCQVFEDRLRRESSDNKNLKYGTRYPKHYLNFMILMRSRGGSTAQQFGILAAELGGPSPRHLRSLVANSEDALQIPLLVYENMARVLRLVKSVNFHGAIIISSDCTKVRARLAYSTDFGSHILGSVLPLEECEVDNTEDIDEVIAEIKAKKAMASQTRAIVAKIPLPEIPPLVVALIPTDGKDTAVSIHEQHMMLLKMAERLDLKVLAMGADGAAPELAAQDLMDQEKSDLPPLTYEYPLYGIHLKAPVFKTGPLISITDCPHTRKTGRNQPQYGTHTASMGAGFLTNRSLVDLFETGQSGLVLKDIENVDKQDDGAARRVFHTIALEATTLIENGVRRIRDSFLGLFVYLFVFGTLFDGWLSRTMLVRDRILCALRARFWLHFWHQHIITMSKHYPDLYSTLRSFISPASFRIFNRLCDTLVLLVIAHAQYYPDQPFCPWLLGTEFVEHFFGLAWMILPNFTYAEFLKMVQHIMVRQRILLSGKFKAKREKQSGVGYILDIDSTPLTAEDRRVAVVSITTKEIDQLVELAYREAELICKDLLKIPVPALDHKNPLRLSSMQSVPEDADDSLDEEDITEEDNYDDNMDGQECPAVANIAISATYGAARMSALCDDYEAVLEEARTAPPIIPISIKNQVSINATQIPALAPPSVPTDISLKSELVDDKGKISIACMLQVRRKLQSGTTTKSERVVRIDPKFALRRATDVTDPKDENGKLKMTTQEASQRARVAQALAKDIETEKKAREIRWQNFAKGLRNVIPNEVLPNAATRNINGLFHLKKGSFVIVRNTHKETSRTYIGEVLDLYKMASGNRYGSVKTANTVEELKYLSVKVYLPLMVHNLHITDAYGDDDDDDDDDDIEAPFFTCRHNGRSIELHTHAFAEHVVYHIGWAAFTNEGSHTLRLTGEAAKLWNSFAKPAIQKTLAKLSKIKIPGGKMSM